MRSWRKSFESSQRTPCSRKNATSSLSSRNDAWFAIKFMNRDKPRRRFSRNTWSAKPKRTIEMSPPLSKIAEPAYEAGMTSPETFFGGRFGTESELNH